MLLDADTSAGHSFKQTFSLTTTAELPPPVGPMSYTADGEQTVTIEALEDVTVPFGTFVARRVLQEMTILGQTDTSKLWYVLGVGLIRSDGPPPPGTPPQAGLKTIAWELVSFAP